MGMKKKDFDAVVETQEPGDHYGANFPHSLELFEQMGAAWLTEAMHAAGTLPQDNKVAVLREVVGLSLDPTKGEALGGAGVKVLLVVEYEKPHPDLHTELFVKVPHPPSSSQRYQVSIRDLCDEGEIMFNRVLSAAVPLRVPKYYCGDISRKNTNCCLVCEKLEFAKEWKKLDEFAPFEIFPMLDKNKDYNIPDKGRSMYPALGKAMGKLVGAYHSGKMGPPEKLARLFYGASEEVLARHEASWPPAWLQSPSPETLQFVEAQSETNVAQMQGMCIVACDFMLNVCPGLFPTELKDRSWLKQFLKQVSHVAQYQFEIEAYINSSRDCFGLVHGNLQIDNAFFWKNEKGEVEAGLLDWGGVAHANAVNAMVRNWIAAEPEVMDEIDEKVLDAFIKECQANGGPKLDRAKVLYMARLTQATFGFAMATHLSQIYRLYPKKDEVWTEIKDRWDPRVEGVFNMRFPTSNWRNFLLLWKSKTRSPYKVFLKWLNENKWLPKKKAPKNPDAIP